MENKGIVSLESNIVEQSIRDEIAKTHQSRMRRAIEKLVTAALGSVPWVGGFLQAAADFRGEETGQLRINELYRQWLEEHAAKMKRLSGTLAEIASRVTQFGEEVTDRIQSESFLALVRQSFRAWDRAETDEKRDIIQKLLTNAAGIKLCSDDLVRLFIDWIDKYHEAHFKVIRVVYKNPGATRADIWHGIHGELLREDSPEADLFKLLIHDLSLGHVIRQQRSTTSDGQFLKKPRPSRRLAASPVMKSAFNDTDAYELTGLGRQFVEYAMTELVPRLGDSPARPSGDAPV